VYLICCTCFLNIEIMKFKLLFLLFLLIISCESFNDDVIEIDPPSFENNKISLADISDKIEYIKLDNTYSLGFIFSFRLVNNTIYLSSQNNGILTFDKSGKFIQRIGRIGKGPGEYLYYLSFAIDELNNRIYVLDGKNRRITVYSNNGVFIKNISLKQYGGYLSDIEYHNSKLIISESISNGYAKYNWIVIDTLGNLVNYKMNSIPEFKSNLSALSGLYKFKDKLNYWNWYSDSVFYISPEFNSGLSKLFTPGKHRIPRNETVNLGPYVRTSLLFETTKYVVLIYGYFKQGRIAFIDKKTRKTFLSEWKGDNSSGILNDFDSGPNFTPTYYFEENGKEYLLGYSYAYNFTKLINSDAFKTSTPKFLKKKSELEKLANSLNENDNPVLMLVKLKE